MLVSAIRQCDVEFELRFYLRPIFDYPRGKDTKRRYSKGYHQWIDGGILSRRGFSRETGVGHQAAKFENLSRLEA